MSMLLVIDTLKRNGVCACDIIILIALLFIIVFIIVWSFDLSLIKIVKQEEAKQAIITFYLIL